MDGCDVMLVAMVAMAAAAAAAAVMAVVVVEVVTVAVFLETQNYIRPIFLRGLDEHD